MPVSGRVAIIAPPHSTRTTIASRRPGGGFRHRPADRSGRRAPCRHRKRAL